MDAEEVTVVVIQNFRSSGSFRKGFVCERGCFFMGLIIPASLFNPEDYILSVLTPEERLDAAFRVAEAAFKGTNLTMKDVENAVKTIRRKAYATKK